MTPGDMHRLSRWDLRDPELAAGQSPVVTYSDGKDYGRRAHLTAMATAGEPRSRYCCH